VLSTAIIGLSELEVASAILSIGLLDEHIDAVQLSPDSLVLELIEGDFTDGSSRYVLPSPDGQFALLAEFNANHGCDVELSRRFERLMTSFRWAS
jgi:hypothetical protein